MLTEAQESRYVNSFISYVAKYTNILKILFHDKNIMKKSSQRSFILEIGNKNM